MNTSDLTGEPLGSVVLAALAEGASRDALYPALLAEPLILSYLAHSAEPGPALRITGGALTRLVESPALRVPVVPLYTSASALHAAAKARAYWPDGIERATVLERGAMFPLLRGHPGALVVVDEDHTLPLDAGEVAALADRKSPDEYRAELQALARRGRSREVAQRLAPRPLYVLGHPKGGLLLLEREIPVFLHLATAERFATRVAAQIGTRAQHGLIAGSELFQNAFRGKLHVVVEPGPDAIRLRPLAFR